MEEQVGDDHVPALAPIVDRRPSRARRRSAAAPASRRRRRRRCVAAIDDRLAVEQVELDTGPAVAAVPGDLEHQPAVAAAELEDAQRAGAGPSAARSACQRAREDAARAHERIDAAQVAARALRRRVVGREVVERLRLETRAACVVSSHLQQRAVAAEAGAERRQPPPAAGRIVGQRGLEHEVDERAREVAVLAQHRRAVAERPSASSSKRRSSASSTSRPPACMIQAAMSPRRQAGALRAPSRARAARSRRPAPAPRASGCCAACRRAARTSAPCAARGSISEARVDPFDAPRPRAVAGSRESTAAPAPSPNRQALISTPGSLSRYIAALLTSTQIDSTCAAGARGEQRSAELQVGQARRRSPGRRGRRPARRRAGRAARRRSPPSPGRDSRCRC